jgi:hypothetical protein
VGEREEGISANKKHKIGKENTAKIARIREPNEYTFLLAY